MRTTTTSNRNDSSGNKKISRPLQILTIVVLTLMWMCLCIVIIVKITIQQHITSSQELLNVVHDDIKQRFIIREKDSRAQKAEKILSLLLEEHDSSLEQEKETTNSSRRKQNNQHHHCLTLDVEMKHLVQESDQIYIAMPTKAAGSSLRIFVNSKCMKYRAQDYTFHAGWRAKRSFLQDVYETPKVIASHVKGNELVSLIQQMTRNSLLIYIHREETDRVISAVRHIVDTRLCSDEQVWKRTPLVDGKDNDSFVIRNGTRCIITDDTLFNQVVTHKRRLEIGHGAPEALTCELYEAIKENTPKMVFMNYTQSDRLMELIASKYCPNEKPFHANTNNVKNGITSMVNLTRSGELVELKDWLEKKRNVLEWALDLKQGATCQGHTKKMEDILFSCSDGIVDKEFLM
jgi:hypothetical protein